MSPPTLSNLPDEMLREILSFLHPSTHKNLAATSKSIHRQTETYKYTFDDSANDIINYMIDNEGNDTFVVSAPNPYVYGNNPDKYWYMFVLIPIYALSCCCFCHGCLPCINRYTRLKQWWERRKLLRREVLAARARRSRVIDAAAGVAAAVGTVEEVRARAVMDRIVLDNQAEAMDRV